MRFPCLRDMLTGNFSAALALQRYFATAVGKNKQGAKGELEKLDLATMTCRQAVNEVAKM